MCLAEGTPPLSYQWSFNGTNLLDATNSVLVITNVQLTDAGNYAVEVSNVFGSEQSSNAVLVVGEPPAIVAQPADQINPDSELRRLLPLQRRARRLWITNGPLAAPIWWGRPTTCS